MIEEATGTRMYESKRENKGKSGIKLTEPRANGWARLRDSLRVHKQKVQSRNGKI